MSASDLENQIERTELVAAPANATSLRLQNLLMLQSLMTLKSMMALMSMIRLQSELVVSLPRLHQALHFAHGWTS
jgi:hypothetical protein